LGRTRQGSGESDRQTGGRQPNRSVFSLPHFPALHFALPPFIPNHAPHASLGIGYDILL
jgi:hypothetical protein